MQKWSSFGTGFTPCVHANLVYDPNKGEVTCNSCGLVSDDRILNPSSEWRSLEEPHHWSILGKDFTIMNP